MYGSSNNRRGATDPPAGSRRDAADRRHRPAPHRNHVLRPSYGFRSVEASITEETSSRSSAPAVSTSGSRLRGAKALAAAGILAGCVFLATNDLELPRFGWGLAADQGVIPDQQSRLLRAEDSDSFYNKLYDFVSRLFAFSSSSRSARPAIISRGPLELTARSGRSFRFDGNESGQGVKWYRMLSSPRFQWNAAPYRWNTCPEDENRFLGNTGFTFREPHPQDASQIINKYVQFQVLRKDERECLWNYSEACLAGGSFAMKFGMTARDILRPGDYSLKTSDGVIRIVAYNTNRDCMIADTPEITSLPQDAEPRSPLDFLRETRSSTMDPKRCDKWIAERQTKEDLLSFNSDLATVHVTTPWMTITVQVRQNKVGTYDGTEGRCVYANMEVYITDMSPEVMDEEHSGVLGEAGSLASRAERKLRQRGPGRGEAEEHLVDGPFGV